MWGLGWGLEARVQVYGSGSIRYYGLGREESTGQEMPEFQLAYL